MAIRSDDCRRAHPLQQEALRVTRKQHATRRSCRGARDGRTRGRATASRSRLGRGRDTDGRRLTVCENTAGWLAIAFAVAPAICPSESFGDMAILMVAGASLFFFRHRTRRPDYDDPKRVNAIASFPRPAAAAGGCPTKAFLTRAVCAPRCRWRHLNHTDRRGPARGAPSPSRRGGPRARYRVHD